MKILFDKMREAFPEVSERMAGDEELPYMLMHHLSDWLKSLPQAEFTPALTRRVASFGAWCQEQPRCDDAAGDLLTIWHVGFVEDIFDTDKTRRLLPRLFTRADLIHNADYLRRWCGSENYDKALQLFEPTAAEKRRARKHAGRRRKPADRN